MSYLIKFSELIGLLQSTNSYLEKQKILKDYFRKLSKKDKVDVISLLVYVFDKLITFGITKSNILKFTKNKNYDKTEYTEYNDIFSLLDDLSERNITGSTALKSANEFAKSTNHFQLVLDIINKKININMNIKRLNEAFGKNIIKEFNVVLAKKYNKEKDKINNKWLISRKLDGVRCIVIVENGEINILSRQGKPIKNVESVFSNLPTNKNYVLDGELIYKSNNNKIFEENFNKVMSIIGHKTKSKVEKELKNIYYYSFDMIPISDFYNLDNKTNKSLNLRLKDLDKLLKDNKLDKIKILKQYKYSEETFEKLKEDVVKHGYEGLMLRKADVPYKSGRIKHLLKVKAFHDAEYKVKDVVFDKMVMNAKTKPEMTLKAIIINNKGTEVLVGSGFTADQRRYYYTHPKELIGKIVTVQYFEETEDKSLRFPTLKTIHGTKREY